VCTANQVCDITGCAPGASGNCVANPGFCSKLWAPVCGCDNVTYANNCFRLLAGVALAYAGQCHYTDSGIVTVCGGTSGVTCPVNYFCNILTCQLGVTGLCEPSNLICPIGGDPVCGCDGNTYPNDCLRMKAQVALSHKGAC